MSALQTFQWHPREHNWWTAKGMDHAIAFQQIKKFFAGAGRVIRQTTNDINKEKQVLSSACSLNEIMERAPSHNRSFECSRTHNKTDESKRQQITYSLHWKRIVCLYRFKQLTFARSKCKTSIKYLGRQISMVYMPQSAVKLAVMMAHTGPDSKMDFHGTCPFWGNELHSWDSCHVL